MYRFISNINMQLLSNSFILSSVGQDRTPKQFRLNSLKNVNKRWNNETLFKTYIPVVEKDYAIIISRNSTR